MNAHRHVADFLILCLVAGLGHSAALGQDESAAQQAAFGSLRGVTLGPQGMPLATVSVVLNGMSTASERQIVSGADGTFAVEDLQPGPYQITASKEGFRSASPTTVELAENQASN